MLPFVQDRARCDGRRTAWGASLGGLLSAQLAWENPELFQTVVTQSAAYLFSEDMDLENPFSGNESLLAEVEGASPRPVRWHLQCGTLEWLLPSNRRLAATLVATGHEVEFITANAGHNWVNWRNGLSAGFGFALGAAAR